ncbi:DUF5681 domain-containing protein [Sphingopyxis sp. BSN-002]|uniref:DUF5681 domain-containing protein n=1 Tax=Sphingopyxis sp. BSN-002 TaxID=2911495 RepID=UPI001EDB6D18|nr:DUF5681 domain-containing protein [Sphingopyxis sp. BSN-002]UKK86158.1 DUF5681 domain-containing protein [Sphingopyxis sp. BSN-002]
MAKRGENDDALPASSFDVDDEDPFGYEVGYKRPPKATRFKAGNRAAAGRKKKPRTLTSDILKVLDEKTEVTLGGKKVKITNRELIARTAVRDAVSGKPGASRALRLLLSIGNENEEVIPEHTINVRFVPAMDLDDPRRTNLLNGGCDEKIKGD